MTSYTGQRVRALFIQFPHLTDTSTIIPEVDPNHGRVCKPSEKRKPAADP